jgi:hypothetical protein
MDYSARVKEIRLRTKNEATLKFVDFLDTLVEWISIIYQAKRLSSEQKKKVDTYLPIKTLEYLSTLSNTEISQEEYNKLKRILLEESTLLVKVIMEVGNLRIHDFDILQFNLYQIFGKEELASMMEWARLKLEKEIEKRRENEERLKRESKKKEEEYHAYIQSLSQDELNHLAYSTVFDFTPSARTPQEHVVAIEKANQTMSRQRIKFSKFESRLQEATEEAHKNSQNIVFRKIGEVRTKANDSAQKFRKKAAFLVSPEGPRKGAEKAQERIRKAEKSTMRRVEESRKNFIEAEKMFTRAQKRIIGKRRELEHAEYERRSFIREQGMVQVRRGRGMISKAQRHLASEEEGTKTMFAGAREYLEKSKDHLEKEKVYTEKLFERGREYLAVSKEHLQLEQEDFSHRKGEEERRLDKERDRVRALEEKLAQTHQSLSLRISEEKERIAGERQKVSSASLKLKDVGISAQKNIHVVKANLAEQRKGVTGRARKSVNTAGQASVIGGYQEKILKGFLSKKEKLVSNLTLKKEQLAYDVRFKQYSLQQNAKNQAETMTAKFETFQDTQQKFLSRHRASRKAKMIRSLLKAIRSMQ